jgi:hypothetical protein
LDSVFFKVFFYCSAKGAQQPPPGGASSFGLFWSPVSSDVFVCFNQVFSLFFI